MSVDSDAMSIVEAGRLLNLIAEAVWKLAALGRIRVVELPGRPAKVSRESVMKLVAERKRAETSASRRGRRRTQPAAAAAGK
jgi:hypothetical protein